MAAVGTKKPDAWPGLEGNQVCARLSRLTSLGDADVALSPIADYFLRRLSIAIPPRASRLIVAGSGIVTSIASFSVVAMRISST